jgi:hypothetical protein
MVPDPAHVSAAKGAHSFGKDPRDVVEAVRLFLAGLG